ncbi:MAG: CCA tRNA nucleotidyltransferase [Deltaproteobacteria bacterium]|nr:CCA tRNA nucleotidyltransferase [Deltaproteobacteria bacterium]
MSLIPPRLVTEIAEDCRLAGGRALLVGGCVRDHLMGLPVKDWDVEVHGVTLEALRALLLERGRVDEVGRSFGVFKIRRGRAELDVSVPRRDSRQGPGHRGISVQGDPWMGLHEAVRRRDLTVNAVYFDPLSRELIDPSGGLDDLAARRLRAVDADTFLEDPLRALRVVQFAARLDFAVDDALVALCREAPLDELPPERVEGEWRKLLVQGVARERAMGVARAMRILPRVFPEVEPWSPGALDRLPPIASPRRRYAVALGVWLGQTPRDGVERTLDRLRLHKVEGWDLRRAVLELRRARDLPLEGSAALKLASAQVELQLLLWLRRAEGGSVDWDLAGQLGILTDPPSPWIRGRDLLGLGFARGPHLGPLLREIYRLQLSERLSDPDEALALAKKYALEREEPLKS